MSENFCSCKSWNALRTNNRNVFKWHEPYGWVITWIELTEENGYTQVDTYGVKIYYCPLCGKKLKSNFEEK